MEQNIVDLGFDTAGFSADQKAVLAGLQQVYEVATKIDGLKIAPTVDPSWKDLKAAISAQAIEIKKLQDANVQYIKSQEALTKADTAVIKQMQEEEKLLQQQAATRKALTAEKEKSASIAAKEAKQIADLSNEYLQLNKAHQDQIMRYRNLALVKGEDNAATLEALETANKTGAILSRLDQNLNIHNRNVGNYKSAYDGLGFSFTQVARELPSLSNGFQQFALAISNNLPMVADEIGRTKAEIAALRAEGKEAPSLLSKIASGIMSWQVGLSVGIALLTAFAKPLSEYVMGLFDASIAEEKAATKAFELNKAYLDLLKTQKEIAALTKPDVGAVRNLENELAYAKARNEQQTKLYDIEIQLGEKRAYYAQKAKEATTADVDLLAARITVLQQNYDQQVKLDIENNVFDEEKYKNRRERMKLEIDTAKEQFLTQKAIDLEYYNSSRDLAAKRLEYEQYIAAEERKLVLFNAIQKAEIQKDANERTLRNEASTQAERLAALKSSAQQEKDILAAQNRDKQNTPGLSDNDKAISARETAAKIKKVDKDLAESTYKLNEDYRKRNRDATQAMFESNLALQEMYNQLALDNELATLNEKLKAQDSNASMRIERENARYALEKDKKGLTDKELESIEERHQNNLTQIGLKATIDRLKLISEIQISEAKKSATIAETSNINDLIRDYQRLQDNLQAKTITYEQYTKEKARIDRNYADGALLGQIDALTQQKAILEKGKKDTIDIDNQIAQLKKQYQERQLAGTVDLSKKETEVRKQQADKEKELAFTTLELLQTVFTAQYENEKNRIQDLINLSDERYRKEIQNIQNSTLSEQDKANKIKVLEADQAAQRRKYEQEIREQNIKKAKADRAFQIFQIAGNTAIGITSALAQFPPNPILAAIIGAIGAVQIAKVLATPIPRYAQGAGVNGRPKHPGGIAEYGEAGPERVDLPTGESFIADKQTVGYLPPETVITPLSPSEVNESMHRGAMRLQSARISGDTVQIDTAWQIARWQSRQTVGAIKQLAKRPNIVRVNMGGVTAGYINSQFGRS